MKLNYLKWCKEKLKNKFYYKKNNNLNNKHFKKNKKKLI